MDNIGIREWTRTIPNNGLIRYYMAANIERVIVVGQEALSEILVSKVYDFPKSESLRVKLLRFTGNGILLAEGEEHKQQRRGLLPSFSFRNIKNLYPVFWAKAVEMADALDKQLLPGSNDAVVQISDWAGRVTLDIVGLAAMGRDFDAVRDPHAEFHKKYDKLRMKPTTITRLLVLFSMLTVGFKAYFALPTKWNRESKISADYIRRYARQIVEDKKNNLKHGSAKSKDIASLAMASGVFSDDNMVDQMITFLVAGHETIAASLQWAVYALCKHPDMQIRLREEVRSHISTSTESTITAADIDSLPYLNAFCNEVLRFYPPVPSTVREARIDTTLAGSFIPKGTTLLILAGATNLDTARWGPDAEKFDPERWLGEGRANSGGSDSNYANLTFLAGPRGCIGQAFAKSELLCLVAVLVGRFTMELQEPEKKLEIVRAISSAPKDGVMARLARVEG
ncbi:putative cytochrome P450 monooxygenase [Coniochaeta sp. PMI_546]|nr:putative cytochrome P450 monooxygenase [Coniochaeta sp. PMI_546]